MTSESSNRIYNNSVVNTSILSFVDLQILQTFIIKIECTMLQGIEQTG